MMYISELFQYLYFSFFYINLMDVYPLEVLNLIESINIPQALDFFSDYYQLYGADHTTTFGDTVGGTMRWGMISFDSEFRMTYYPLYNTPLYNNDHIYTENEEIELVDYVKGSDIPVYSHIKKYGTIHIYGHHYEVSTSFLGYISNLFEYQKKSYCFIIFLLNFLFVKSFFFTVTPLTFWLIPQLILFIGGLISFLLIKTNDLNIWIWNLSWSILLLSFLMQLNNLYIYISFFNKGLALKVGLDGLLTLSYNIHFAKLLTFLVILIILYISFIFLHKNYFQTLYLIKPELCSLMLFLGFGVGMVFLQNDLFSIFLYLELISFCIYGFLFLHQRTSAQLHGLIRYVLFSLWMASFYILGVSLYLSWTNFNTNLSYFWTSTINSVSELISFSGTEHFNVFNSNPELILSITFLITYFLFKLGAGPFYTWVIDVYNSCSTGVLLAVSVIPKLVYIPILFYILYFNFLFFYEYWTTLLFVVGLITIFIGSTGILITDKLKEIYAWSSIVHTGNILILLSCVTCYTLPFCFFYLISYSIISFCFISLIISLKNKSTGRFIKTMYDLSSINSLPVSFNIVAVIIVSSAVGFTPLLSFFMKFSVFLVISSQYGVFIAIFIGIVNVIGAIAYLKILWNIIGYDIDKFANRKSSKIATKLSLYMDYWIALILNFSCVIICTAFFFYLESLSLFYFTDDWLWVDKHSKIFFI